MSYPPSPWRLRGHLHASVWLVPRSDLPVQPPPGTRLLSIGGRTIVGTAFVVYRPGGVLHYRELLTAVLVRRGPRVLTSITHIWVDSPASRDGGRALWAIPKELAEFETRAGEPFAARARDAGGPIVEAVSGRTLGLPGRWPVGFSIVQRRAGAALVNPVRCTARLALASGHWSFADAGPLRFLRGRRPLLSFTLTGFRMRFGRPAPEAVGQDTMTGPPATP